MEYLKTALNIPFSSLSRIFYGPIVRQVAFSQVFRLYTKYRSWEE